MAFAPSRLHISQCLKPDLWASCRNLLCVLVFTAWDLTVWRSHSESAWHTHLTHMISWSNKSIRNKRVVLSLPNDLNYSQHNVLIENDFHLRCGTYKTYKTDTQAQKQSVTDAVKPTAQPKNNIWHALAFMDVREEHYVCCTCSEWYCYRKDIVGLRWNLAKPWNRMSTVHYSSTLEHIQT